MNRKPSNEELAQKVEELGNELAQCQKLEESLKNAQNQIAALLEGARAVLKHQRFKETVRAIFNHCKNLLGATAGYVTLLDKKGVQNEVLVLDPGGLACTVNPDLPMPIRGLRSEAYHTGKAVYHNDFVNSRWVKYMPDGHVRLSNVMFAPLVIEGQACGLLGLANKPGGFTENDALMATAFGELAAIALLNSRTLQALENNEKRFRSVAETANDAIITVDLYGEIVFWNQGAETIFGYSVKEIVGKPLFLIIPERYRKAHQKGLARVCETGKSDLIGEIIELEGIRKDGSEFPLELSLATWRTDDGIFFTGIIRDISKRKRQEEERKKMEAQLQNALRMESIGTLAAGIAHNFNNLLMGIQGNASLMLLQADSEHSFNQNLKNVEKLVQDGSKLTNQLLGYAREGQYEVKPINLNQLVEETSDTFGTTKKEIRIHKELSESLYGIKADQGQIEQVLLNLYINAADAMPGGGDLFIKTMNLTHKDLHRKPYSPKPGDYVLLEIDDTGIGMDKKTMKHIFEPFFTTKGLANGTGLGLASAYGIIKGHGGYIDVESEKGHGTTFRIYLPATTAEVHAKRNISDSFQIGNGTVLLVDDEEMIVNVGEDMLKNLGYEVFSATNGQKALEIFEKNNNEIDIVLLDMVMPVMGGGETYDRLKTINSEVKVLLSSGYNIDGEAKEILNRGCDGFIQKPFSINEISQKLREILDQTSSFIRQKCP